MSESSSRRIAKWLCGHPWIVSGGLALVLAAGFWAGPRLRVEAGLDPYYDPGSSTRQLLSRIERRFVGDDVLYVAYRTDDPFSRRRLSELREFGKELEQLRVRGKNGRLRPAVDRLTSLATVDDLQGSELSFRTQPLVADPMPDRADLSSHLRRRALANPLIRDWLLGNDRHVAALVLRLQADLSDAQRSESVAAVRRLLAERQRRIPQTRYWLAGVPVINADIARYQSEDAGRMIPIAYGLVTVALFVFVRRLGGLLLAIVAVTLGFVGTLALLVALGSSVNNTSVMLPPIIITLTTAMLLHFFSELGKRSETVPLAAAEATLDGLLAPGAMAALTTAVGFGALAVSDIPAVRFFGLSAAGGVLLAFSVTTGMFVLAARKLSRDRLVSPRGYARAMGMERAVDAIADFVLRRRWEIVVAAVAVTLLVAAGVTRLEVDNREIDFFDPQTPVRQANDFVEAELAGTTMLVIAIDGGRRDRFCEPRALRKLEGLQRFLREKIGMQKVSSLIDVVKLMHREFENGDPSQYRVPDSHEKIAQLLLLNGDRTLEEYLDDERRWVRVVARTRNVSSFDVSRDVQQIEHYLARSFRDTDGFRSYVTGRSRLGAEMVNRLIRSQIRSLTLSLTLIFGIIFALFRSLRSGLMALLPNIAPIALMLGLMGWLGIRLDVATAMISTVAIGIAVDDTIHFIQAYRRAMAEHGEIEQAIRHSLRIKGPAIIWTSVTISLGMSVLLLGSFSATRHFGLLVTVAMIAALLGDLLLLPALILCTRSRLGVRFRGCSR